MGDRISVRIEGGVADVRLTRADKLNALDPAMFAALVETGERLKTEPGLRVVVLSGDGPAFCAGLDKASLESIVAAGEGGGSAAARLLSPERTPGGANSSQQAVMVWREVPVPVIGAIHGVAFGGGFQLTLGCDLRFVAPDARLSVMEIKWGLAPDMGAMVLLPRLVRDDVARDLTFSGRIFSGEAALALGLATRVCADPRAEALAYAHDIAAKSPDAIRAAKRLLNLGADADQRTLLLRESEEQGALIGSANQAEAVLANLQGRAPAFSD